MTVRVCIVNDNESLSSFLSSYAYYINPLSTRSLAHRLARYLPSQLKQDTFHTQNHHAAT